jgi:CheY-like chemotaxis protein
MDTPTVLCIDDRPQGLELRKAALESHGYRIKIVSSSYTAMKMLDETSFAAVYHVSRGDVVPRLTGCSTRPRAPVSVQKLHSET